MTVDVEGKHSERFEKLANDAVTAFDEALGTELGLRVTLLRFDGPHLTPAAGAYAPLDFLRLGMTEKLERDADFLLIVTEVDLAATTLSYTLALPSQLTNIGVVSTKRLEPTFWGDEPDEALTVERLSHLLLHTLGHLLNLPHTDSPHNAMYRFEGVEDLGAMAALTPEQRGHVRRALPREAHERSSRGNRWGFVLQTLLSDWRSIAHAVGEGEPTAFGGAPAHPDHRRAVGYHRRVFQPGDVGRSEHRRAVSAHLVRRYVGRSGNIRALPRFFFRRAATPGPTFSRVERRYRGCSPPSASP